MDKGADLTDIRVYRDTEPIRYLSKPDDEVHFSTLSIEMAGGAHYGLWSCSFKFFDKSNGKLDRREVTFQLNVDGLETGHKCFFDDHCVSGTCYLGRCKCSESQPVYDLVTDNCYTGN